MAKLSSAQRDKMPSKEFAGADRSYPIPDRAHAANAKARASQAVKAGRMSSSEKAKIDAKADKKLGASKPAGKGKPKADPKKTGERLAVWMA